MARRVCYFFFQAEDGIRDVAVTGVQTCALPIYRLSPSRAVPRAKVIGADISRKAITQARDNAAELGVRNVSFVQIGRASCRERVEIRVVGGSIKRKHCSRGTGCIRCRAARRLVM